MKLTTKQIKYLKSNAMEEKILFQVGKDGIGENFLDLIDKALEARELVKFRVLNNCLDPVREIALDVASNTNSLLIQIVGKVITLYRPSKKQIYVLPK